LDALAEELIDSG